MQKDISSEVPKIHAYDGQPVYQACSFITQSEEKSFSKLLPLGTKITRWNKGGVDIISNDGGKINGIKRVIKHFNISSDEIMAFGDAENDTEMLEYAAIGVAMGNAMETVKAEADFITDDIDQNGIRNALLHYQVI